MEISFQPIRVISTDFTSEEQTPIQGAFRGTAAGKVMMHTECAARPEENKDPV